MLDVRQLRYFIAVAEELHFGRAADRLHVAQSAISFQIKDIEKALGAPLFHRSKRAPVSLTETGRRFLVEAYAAVRQLERAERIGRLASRGEIGSVELGYVASAALSGALPTLLRRFRNAYPQVELQITAMETRRQLVALADGKLDVALIRPRPSYPDGVVATIFHREPLVAALAADHPLATRHVLCAADLSNEQFVIPQFSESAGFVNSLGRLGTAGGFTVDVTRQVGDFPTALSMAAAGYGIALGPRSMKSFAIGDLVYRTIVDFEEEVELVAAYRQREASPSARALIDAAIGLNDIEDCGPKEKQGRSNGMKKGKEAVGEEPVVLNKVDTSNAPGRRRSHRNSTV